MGANYGLHFGGIARAGGRAGVEAAALGVPAALIGAAVGGNKGALGGISQEL